MSLGDLERALQPGAAGGVRVSYPSTPIKHHAWHHSHALCRKTTSYPHLPTTMTGSFKEPLKLIKGGSAQQTPRLDIPLPARCSRRGREAWSTCLEGGGASGCSSFFPTQLRPITTAARLQKELKGRSWLEKGRLGTLEILSSSQLSPRPS